MHTMQRKANLTTVVISHDVNIFDYVDNVALLYNGTIRYFGKASTIWESDNPYIYQFIRGLSEGPIPTEV
jgi:ABC-type transporter Mla maintaining outer membrane lipid asymmetry ATPase subunit MlaF